MENLRIAIYENKPFYVSLNGTVDFYLLIKALCDVLSNSSKIEQLTDKDFDEYQSKFTIKGDSIGDWIRAYDIIIWKWNPIMNDFTNFTF